MMNGTVVGSQIFTIPPVNYTFVGIESTTAFDEIEMVNPISTLAIAIDDLYFESLGCVQTITVIDDVAPVAPAAPADVTVECADNVPAPAQLMAMDNCEGAIVGISSDAITPGACPNEYSIVRTWLFKDGCGNQTTVSQNITVDDETAPTAPVLPNLNFQCADDVPLPSPVVLAFDNCQGAVVGVLVADTIPGSCVNDFVITRTYYFTDACNNQSSTVQTITVNDDTDPVVSCPANQSGFQCGDVIPAAAASIADYLALGGTVSDNCTAQGDITISSADVDNGNTECVSDGIRVITRTYTFTDECGNVSTCDQTFTYDEDMSAPVAVCPADVNDIPCLDPVPAGANDGASFVALGGTLSDNCTDLAGISVSFVDVDNGGIGCANDPHIVTRTYTFVDACGNTSTCTQLFNYEIIVEPPVLNCPIDLTCLCGNPDNPLLIANWIATFSATSNCMLNVTLSNDYPNGTIVGGCGNSGTQAVSFTAVDECGNTASCTANIIFIDNNPPELDCPAGPVTVGTDPGACEADIPMGGAAMIGALDKCDPNFTITNDSPYAVDPNSADAYGVYPVGMHVITFNAMDACGNSSSCTLILNVADQEDPMITCPANISVSADVASCGATVSFTAPTISDNCPGAVLMQTAGLSSGDFFPVGMTTQSYMVMDAAGNTASCSFTITVGNILDELCTLSSYEVGIPSEFAIILGSLPGVANPYYVFDNGGTLAVNNDGTANIIGTVVNKADANVQFDVNILLENEADWTAWSAMGRLYKFNANNQAVALANHMDWTFWELSGSSTLTGSAGSTFDGDVLTLSHKPGDYTYGFQKGLGANDKDNDFGISGWFYYSGTLGGNAVSGDGDVNADASCQANPCGVSVVVAPRVMLEGVYDANTGLMRHDLSTLGFLPLIEPYTAEGYTHYGNGGGEMTTAVILAQTGNNAVVDWIVVELRDATDHTQIIATASALLLADGSIVDPMDTNQPVTFENVAEGNYYVAINHRTHLTVMTDVTFSLDASGNLLDFSDGTIPTYGADPQADLSATLKGMYCGDGVHDNVINAADRAAVWNARNQTGYKCEDVNLDGVVNAADRSTVWNNRNKTGVQ